MLKIKTNGRARDMWKFARACKQLRLLGPPDPGNLPGTVLLSGLECFEIHRVRQYLVSLVLFGIKEL